MDEVRPGDEENRVGMGVLSFSQVCKLGVFFSTAPTTYKLAYSGEDSGPNDRTPVPNSFSS